MSRTADKNANNLYLQSRDRAGITNRLDAAWMLHISDRTLARWEALETVPPAEKVLAMEEKYGDRKLAARHCSEVCPIGRRRANKVEDKSLEAAVLGLIKEYNDVKFIRDRLIEIAADGVIDETEREDFDGIMAELADLEQKIYTLKLWAAAGFRDKKKTAAM